jgi:CheY-like chemotaxis protein
MDGENFIQFCIGNENSYIPPEHFPNLFDAFFTSGKKDGTGLGLAIAQKIVATHGGKIWCESIQDEQFPRGKVEFFFTIPCSTELCQYRIDHLYASGNEFVEHLATARKHLSMKGVVDTNDREHLLERELINFLRQHEEPLSVLIVDDEAVYRNSLSTLMRSIDKNLQLIVLLEAKNSTEALAFCKVNQPDLVILDVDLGLGSLNGLEMVQLLRSQGINSRVCIHSNRFLADDYKVAIEAGANSVLPKPLPRSHLLKLLLDATNARCQQSLTPQKQEVPEFVFLDDMSIFRKSWELKNKNKFILHTYDSPAAFLHVLQMNPEFLKNLRCVVTDYFFGEGAQDNGAALAEKLRQLGFQKPIFLASDGEFTSDQIGVAITRVISKQSRSFDELELYIK